MRWCERVCRPIVRERSGGICELCPRMAAQMHHRRNRSQGGQWNPSNLLHLCVECHVWIGGNIAAAVRNGWSIQGTIARSDEVAVLLREGGRWFLDDSGGVEPAGEAA